MGAITIGSTVMTEFGMTPNGSNAKRAMPRNPHAVGHIAGGSSTGSGAVLQETASMAAAARASRTNSHGLFLILPIFSPPL